MTTLSASAQALAALVHGQQVPHMGLGAALHAPQADTVFSMGRLHAPSPEPVRPDTRFHFGSFTKVLTAALVGRLVSAGRASLDDKLTRFLPAHAGFGEVTLRHLLSHTSGGTDLYEPLADADAVVAKMAATGFRARPGQEFSYSNAGYVALGRVVEELSGQSWMDNLRTDLLEPLGLDSVACDGVDPRRMAQGHAPSPQTGQLVPMPLWPDVGNAMDAAGGRLVGTADDAARLALAIATGKAGDVQLLSPSVVADMLTPQVVVPGIGLMATHWCLGWSQLGLAADGTPVFGHMGGTSVLAAAQPSAARSCAVLTNTPFGAAIGRAVADQYFGTRLTDAPQGLKQRDLPAEFERFAGRYVRGPLNLEIVFRDGQLLFAHPMTGEVHAFSHLEGTRFIADVGGLTSEATFMPDALHFGLRLIPRV